MKRKLVAFVCLLGIALVPCLSFALQGSSDHSVDPSTLNPPPPPQFNPVCEKVGGGTICTVQFSDPPFAGGSGVFCGSGAGSYEVETGRPEAVRMQAWRRHLHGYARRAQRLFP